MCRLLGLLLAILCLADAAAAEVVRIDIRRRDDFGTHERIIAKVHFTVRPADVANGAIADILEAPRNATGLVEFSSDLLYFQPKDATRARGTVFLEIVNRGRDQALALMSDAGQRDMAPENWNLGDRFLLEKGFTVAFLGWQFDVPAPDGLTFQAPVANVQSLVRGNFLEDGTGRAVTSFDLRYCAADPNERTAVLSQRTAFNEDPIPVPRARWSFSADGCTVNRPGGFTLGLHEVVYTGKASPVAGLGLAAIRDFASYLRYGGAVTTLRENPALVRRVIGFGYSQSARLLRDFVRDGFNADERGRQAFDALFIASAGAGGGSFNHRYAMPGQAGNSVLSALRPVDLPPFTDAPLLARARSANVLPRIFYTFSSTEYWARAGSLTHTTEDGMTDVPFGPSSRLYFLAGTPHSGGPPPVRRDLRYRGFLQMPNFAEQRWPMRALLIALDEWIRQGTAPPPSRYPTLAKGELVARGNVLFPAIPRMPFAPYVPPVYRLDYGPQFSTTRVITQEPPRAGEALPVLLPQVNADGNDVGGVPLTEIAVPLGTYTGWNIALPQLTSFRYLGGLVGSFEPFPLTRAEREQTGDDRASIAERYAGRQDYLDKVKRAAEDLVRQRFALAEDVPAMVERAALMWDALAN